MLYACVRFVQCIGNGRHGVESGVVRLCVVRRKLHLQCYPDVGAFSRRRLAWQSHMICACISPHQQLVPEHASTPVYVWLLPDHRTLLAGRCKQYTGILRTALHWQNLSVHIGVARGAKEGQNAY
jgi:hypothetical protein